MPWSFLANHLIATSATGTARHPKVVITIKLASSSEATLKAHGSKSHSNRKAIPT